MKSLLAIIAVAFSLNSFAAETKEPVKKASAPAKTASAPEKKAPSATKPKVKKKAEKEVTK